MDSLKGRFVAFLRWTERYTKTDMVYLTKSSSWMNLNFVLLSIFSLLLSIGFANILSKQAYGTYQYILSIAAFFAALTFSGFNTAITESVARGIEGIFRASIRPQILWNLIPALGALVLSVYYFILGNTLLGFGTFLVAVTVPILNTFNAYTAYLFGKQDFKRASLYALCGNGMYYVLMFLTLAFYPSALLLIAVNLCITAAAAVFFYVRTIAIYHPPIKNDSSTVTYARHLSVINILTLIANQVDNIFVFHFLGPVMLAQYSLASLIPERIGGMFKSLTSSALPRFASRNLTQIRENMLVRLLLLLIGVLVIIVLYAAIAPFFFRVVYPEYAAAVPYSQMYALTIVGVVGGIVTSAFYAHRRVKELYILNTAVPLFQITVQVLAIILWGIWGLIVAKIISSIVTSITSLLLLRRDAPLPPGN